MANTVLTKLHPLWRPPQLICLPSRTTTTKHFDPKFRTHRAKKYQKIELPDMNEDENKFSEQKMRQKMKERGILPPRPWMERPFYIGATGGIFEPYVPPEGDGKASLVSTSRAKQTVQLLEKKSKSMLAIRKVKSFDEDFDTKEFCQQAQNIYIKAHESLVNGFRYQPGFWELAVSAPVPQRARQAVGPGTSHLIVITVRFHSRQQLAVYDRFGRLLHGSEILAKDVLEYVVFEKHLSNLYGAWRVHDKIIPDWAPPKDPSRLTRVKPDPEPVKVEEEVGEAQKDEQPAIADK
ncbi:jg4733 [Pararge aegeria aegeria]|uniref:Large ribosomal subunit protein mL45 n=1 Tax=Pararge aegeria aegeria TaxID=348720 RepID=A0A8S4RB12_9NEOP|nr:jg4733 [Pararge aegeria aegeria]